MREILKIGDYVQVLKSPASKMLIEDIVEGTAHCVYLDGSGETGRRQIQTSVLYKTEQDETFQLLMSTIKSNKS